MALHNIRYMTTQPVRIQLDVKIPMRDGVLLSADIYRPPSGGPFPALLIRTIYDKQQARYVAWTRRFVERGYAVVMQDCRGRHDSGGSWKPYVNEADDGYDTHEWIGKQPWCDGNVGAFGISYVGFTQTLPATQRSPYLKALAPIASQQDNFGHFYVDGALQLHVAMFFMNMTGRTMKREATSLMDWDELWRRLPLVSALDDIVDLPFYRDVIRHSSFDDFWKAYGLRNRYDQVEAPAYFITGWYDNLLHEAFKQYQGWSAQARSHDARMLSRLLVGPWSHQNIGSAEPFGSNFGGAANLDIVEEQLRWFDRRLKGVANGMDDEPPIRIFVMGENVWRSEREWPLARTRYTRFYLHSRGAANSLHGNGSLSATPPADEPPDRYSYDPNDPVPTIGGQYMLLVNSGPFDRRPLERRDDVLVYTTEPLARDLEVTGPVTLTLHASSSAPDTDFAATLVDVHPDGKAIILSEGLLRARFRESIERPTLIEPGRVYEYRIPIWETSNLFKAGHRIRLEVSSSNFPRFDRNPNTGRQPGMDAELRTADQTIFHDAQRPSHLTLPVIPR
jgi:putative CocE/NonD family hydrolase